MEIVKSPDIQVFASEAKTGEILKFPDVLRGWGVALDQTQGKPPIEWMNDAFNRIDLNNLYLLQQGIPEWSASIRYPLHSIVKHEGKIYLCTLENENYTPSTSSDRWSLYVKNASEKEAGIAKIATKEEIKSGTNDAAIVTPKKLSEFLSNSMSSITKGYDPTFQYEAGDIVKVNGVYYECYHPEGCKGIDPTNRENRPSGWTNADPHAPYYWVEIGKFLMLPEIGSPIYLMNTAPREGLIKLRNDGQLSATKFWRIAELNPNLVSNGLITLADMRANVIRALDDGKGIDVGRAINSYQQDALQDFEFGFSIRNMRGPNGTSSVQGGWPNKGMSQTVVPTGGISVTQESTPANGGSTDFTSNISSVARTANETRMKNIAMLCAIRI